MRVHYKLSYLAGLAEADRIIVDGLEDYPSEGTPYLLQLAYAMRGLAEGIATGDVLRKNDVTLINAALAKTSLGVDFRTYPISRLEYAPDGAASGFTGPVVHGELVWQFERPAASKDTAALHAILDLVEPLVQLLDLSTTQNFKLRRCLNDSRWFSPATRSARSKFCSTQCRNRFNYRSKQDERFVCSMCERSLPVLHFSGIRTEESRKRGVSQSELHLCGIDDSDPLCIACAREFPQFKTYLAGALMDAPSPDD